MQSLLDSTEAQQMLRRVHALRPDSRAQWGKMDVAQMLAHCQRPLRVASGELKLRRGLIGILFGGLAKKKLGGEKPFDRGLPTDKAFLVRDARDFAIEKANLLAAVQRFQSGGPSGITREPHPFFGKMSTDEWDHLQWKHLDHHLRQFGA